MSRELSVLDDVQAEILISLHRLQSPNVSELIRTLRLGGDTFYRHKRTLVDAGLVAEIIVRSSRVRKVTLKLTSKGEEAAVLLEELASVLGSQTNKTQANSE